MASHLQVMLLIAVLAIVFGFVLMVVDYLIIKNWPKCNADIVSTEPRDSDWDIVQIEFSVQGKPVSTVVTVQSAFGYSRKIGEAVLIRYNPAAPEEVRLLSSLGFFSSSVYSSWEWVAFGCS